MGIEGFGERLEYPYEELITPRLGKRLKTRAWLDGEEAGNCRYAWLDVDGYNVCVKERVPVHVWKLDDEKKAWHFGKVLERLKEKARREVDKAKKPWE